MIFLDLFIHVLRVVVVVVGDVDWILFCFCIILPLFKACWMQNKDRKKKTIKKFWFQIHLNSELL